MTFGLNENAEMLRSVSRVLHTHRDTLCELDGAIGDGDHGISMDIGFAAVASRLNAAPVATTLSQQYAFSANAFLEAIGASCGPLYATALLRVATYLKQRDSITSADVAHIFEAIAIGIAERGKAIVGDRTMLDVWRPVANSILAAQHEGLPFGQQLMKADACAKSSVAATANMLPKLGRAARLGERALGHVDPGAASAELIIRAMTSAFRQLTDLSLIVPSGSMERPVH